MEITFRPTRKQALALQYLMDGESTEVLYGGAAGSGKSLLGSVWVIINCLQYPGTRWLIGRSKLSSLKQTTMKTFRDTLNSFGLKNYKEYSWSGHSNEIRFANGSEVIMKDLFAYPSDPDFDSLGSLEITGAFLDEVAQISRKAKDIVTSRIRYRLEEYGLLGKIFMTTNPSHNFAYTDFYKPWKNGVLEPYKKFIQALPTDNPHLPKQYIQTLEKLDQVSRARLLLGQWDYEDKLSLFGYDRVIESFDNPLAATGDTYYLTVDVARLGKDKTTIFVWRGMSIVDVRELSKQTLDKQLVIVKELMDKYRIPASKVAIDTDGVGGGLADFIPGCVQVVNNARPFKGENYQNLKTQLYFKLAEVINAGRLDMSGMSDTQQEKTLEELQIIKRTDADKDGKLRITPKDEIKQSIGRSPDYSDNLAYRMMFEYRSKGFSYGY